MSSPARPEFLTASVLAAMAPFRVGGQLERFGTPPGYRDEHYSFSYAFDLTALQDRRETILNVDDDAPFVWRSVLGEQTTAVGPNGPPTGRAQLQFTDPYGRLMQSQLMLLEGFVFSTSTVGGQESGNRPAPIEETIIPAGGYVTVRLLEYFGGTCTVRLSLLGVKRYSEPWRITP